MYKDTKLPYGPVVCAPLGSQGHTRCDLGRVFGPFAVGRLLRWRPSGVLRSLCPSGLLLTATQVAPSMAKVDVDHGRCISCAGCVGVCPVDTITLQGDHLTIEDGPCISCGLCIQFCPVGALEEGLEYGSAHVAKADRIITVEA